MKTMCLATLYESCHAHTVHGHNNVYVCNLRFSPPPLFEQGSEVGQKDDDAAAENLWRKKLVLHGMRVVDDFVGYRENPITQPPAGKDVGFVSASLSSEAATLWFIAELQGCYLGSLICWIIVYKPVEYGARRSEGIYRSEEPVQMVGFFFVREEVCLRIGELVLFLCRYIRFILLVNMEKLN
jgi:hypothetical protein